MGYIMLRRNIFIILTLVLALLAGCSENPHSHPVPEYSTALCGTWEYSDNTGETVYFFNSDGTGIRRISGYELPFTFTADETSLTIVTDCLSFYEGVNGMTFDELVNAGVITADRRYITENYRYSLQNDTLCLTDTAYGNISSSDIASIVLTKTS